MANLFVYGILILVAIALVQVIFEAIFTGIANLINFMFIDYWYLTLLSFVALLLWYRKKQKNAEAEARAKRELDAENEAARILHRDANSQSEPYEYEVGKHANQTLAIRYGLANTKTKNEPYYYYAKGGVKTRDPAKDRKKVFDARTIKLRKIKPLSKENHYLVELTSFKKRKAIAIHVKGEEFVRTFYPLNPDTLEEDKGWWDRNPELELALKDNRSFQLKELARFHVDKTVPVTSRY